MRSDAKPTPDPAVLPPLPRCARPLEERGDAVWFAGRWRSPEGVERVRIRNRLRQRARRIQGTGR
jgi:hypothetical protein